MIFKWFLINELRFSLTRMSEGSTQWHSSCSRMVVKLIHTAVLTVMTASMLVATIVKANSVVLTQGIYSYDVGG